MAYSCDYCDKILRSQQALHQHCSDSSGHPYCVSCRRLFQNENNLMQHMHSRIHVGASMKCPWCKKSFTTASGVTVHLESGACSKSGLDHHSLNEMVQRMDHLNVITKPMLTLPGYDGDEMVATDFAWNGSAFECCLCHKKFAALANLNNDIKSPTHEQDIYHCPKTSCNRQYKRLSGLIQHMESESCGVMRFSDVQQQARSGINNMIGRMIGQ